MKKLIPVFICLLLIASIVSIVSCGFENLPPKALVVKGNPGLYVPIGSPFAGMRKEDRLEYLISPDNIKKMMNTNAAEAGANDDLKIYEVPKDVAEKLNTDHPKLKIDPKVQIYLAHYHLLEMPLNLQKYADDAMKSVKEKRGEINITIPPGSPTPSPGAPLYISYDETDKTTRLLPNEDINKPFIKIPFAKMAKLVKTVEYGPFALEIDYDPTLEQYLEIKIPGFGFDYKTGERIGNKLRYYDNSKIKFYPQKSQEHLNILGEQISDLDDGENLYIYARITNSCSGKFVPEIIFEWDKALIDTTPQEISDKSTFTGSYPIKNNLADFLGDGITFKEVFGFMYMSGVKTNQATLISDIKPNKGRPSINEALHNEDMPKLPDNDVFKGSLYPMSITRGEPLDLTGIFESKDTTLEYAIQIRDMEYEKKDAGESKIMFDLFVLIPMDLKASKKPPSGEINTDKGKINLEKDYVMLDFGDSFKNELWKGDLFGRKEGEENYLKQIDYLNIGIIRTDINIIDASKIWIWAKIGNNNSLMEFKKDSYLKLAGYSSEEFIKSPEFNVLLKKDETDTGSFKILRPDPAEPKFDFKLFVEAKAKLEYKMDF